MRKNYHLNKSGFLIFFCVLQLICVSQIVQEFGWPIDTPHVVTGNYGELRPNHFHLGWDFSTHGKVNLPVYAVASGTISRIKVSASGYGKALYINHPGNKLSLYGHLSAYAEKISMSVKEEQIAKQRYEVELFPASDELLVTKGELIGYSGNSGFSSGPHLHFEIRNQKTEVPLNLLEFYGLKDTILPSVQQIALYDLSDTLNPKLIETLRVQSDKANHLDLEKDSIILNASILGFAFSGFDRFEYKGNPNVIYSAKLFLEEEQRFKYVLNNISFDDQRYVNEFAEKNDKFKYQKCFLPTRYPETIFENCIDKGRINLIDTNFHCLKLAVNDEFNNTNVLQFYFKTRKINGYVKPVVHGDGYLKSGAEMKTDMNGVSITVAAKALYYSTHLTIQNSLETTGQLVILPARVNLNCPVDIKFLVPEKLLKSKHKLILKNESVIYCPKFNGDSIRFSVNSFGYFKLEIDSTAPKIKTLLSRKKIKRIKNFNSFSFDIRDNLSGIGKYNLYLNDQWVLAEYDAKLNILTFFFDGQTPPGNLSFRVEAEDKMGNRSKYKYVLRRR
jgi:hypothetical protein